MPEHYRIRIMPRAASDLVTICSFIELHSPQNAASIARELVTAIDSLEILPHRYKIHQHRKESSKSVRSMPVSPFIVYYRVVHHLHVVEVLTVRHGSRQPPKGF